MIKPFGILALTLLLVACGGAAASPSPGSGAPAANAGLRSATLPSWSDGSLRLRDGDCYTVVPAPLSRPIG